MANTTNNNRKRTPLPVRRSLSRSAENLGAWRKLSGLTQTQLADRAGVAERTVRRLEEGDGGVSTENLFRVLRGLGLLDVIPDALDPYETDLGRARSDENLPTRVRPRALKRS
jgi:transcriptional regulator with XRE-family HTH domain